MNSVRHIWWQRKEPRSEYNCNKPSLYWCIFPSRSFNFYHYVKHRKNLVEKKKSLYLDFSLTARQMYTSHPKNRSKGDIFLAWDLVPRNPIHQHRPQQLPHQCACYGSQDSNLVLKSSQHFQRGTIQSAPVSWRPWTRQTSILVFQRAPDWSLPELIPKYLICVMIFCLCFNK